MKNLKQDDVIFSTDIYSQYSPLIYSTLKLQVQCNERISYPILSHRGGHDISHVASCVGDMVHALSKIPSLSSKEKNTQRFAPMFSIW